MYIMFVDESSTIDNQFLCSVGMVVPFENTIEFCMDIEKIVKKYLGDGYSIFENTNLKCLRRWRKTNKKKEKGLNPFSSITEEKRLCFSMELYSFLKKHDVVLIATIVLKKNIEKLSENFELGKYAYFYLVVERYSYFLKEKNSVGIVIFDETSEIKKKSFVDMVVNKEDYRGRKIRKRIYPNVFFADDEFDVLIQVSDLVAYTLSRYIGSNAKDYQGLCELAEEHDFQANLDNNQYYKSIVGSFRNKSGKINGFGIKIW